MIRLRYGLALVCAAGPAAAGGTFHPVEDKVYHLDTAQTRVADGVVLRFHVRRSVLFHRVESGFEATVTLEAIDRPAGDAGKMFEAATRASLKLPLRFRLDADARVTEVVDADTAMARIAEALAHAGTPQTGRPIRVDQAQASSAPLRSASPAQTRAMLASILQPVVRPDGAAHPEGRHSISLPSRPPMPVDAVLYGTETIVRDATVTTVTVEAKGSFRAPSAEAAPPVGNPSTMLAITRTVDATSGLLREEREFGTITMSGETGTARATVETVTRLELPEREPPVR